jgi:uncharacterized membrane protein
MGPVIDSCASQDKSPSEIAPETTGGLITHQELCSDCWIFISGIASWVVHAVRKRNDERRMIRIIFIVMKLLKM